MWRIKDQLSFKLEEAHWARAARRWPRTLLAGVAVTGPSSAMHGNSAERIFAPIRIYLTTPIIIQYFPSEEAFVARRTR